MQDCKRKSIFKPDKIRQKLISIINDVIFSENNRPLNGPKLKNMANFYCLANKAQRFDFFVRLNRELYA